MVDFNQNSTNNVVDFEGNKVDTSVKVESTNKNNAKVSSKKNTSVKKGAK